MQIQLDTIKTIGIIGSGVAGLTAARFLQSAGFTCEIFEKSEKNEVVFMIHHESLPGDAIAACAAAQAAIASWGKRSHLPYSNYCQNR